MSSGIKGKPIKSGNRQTVLNVFEYFKKLHPTDSVDTLVQKTSGATGTSKRSIYRFRSEYSRGNIASPRKCRKKVEYKNSRGSKYNRFVISAIRRIVHSFFKNNLPPTLSAVLSTVNGESDLPNFKRTTLWTLLKESGFTFEKRNKRSLLIERDDIIIWRHSYLRQIKNCRRQQLPIVYLDETWVNVGQTTNKIWVDKTVKTPKDAFMAGLTTGLKDPTERGPRFVITHAGGEKGFVNGAKMVFLAKKGAADYHDEMDGTRFEQWFEEQLLPNLEAGTVIVMDNASYHSQKLEKIPNSKTKKGDIKTWLRQKNINYAEDSLKKELLDQVASVKHLYSAYKIDEKAKSLGFTVLRLPPYHCELNPIELVWSQVKRNVAMHNTRFKKELMQPLIDNAFDAVTTEHWKNYCRHVELIEENMWEADDLQDDIEPFIIRLNADDESSGEDDGSSNGSAMSGIDPLL